MVNSEEGGGKREEKKRKKIIPFDSIASRGEVNSE